MSLNLGLKALLAWVNSMRLCDQEVDIGDLQDGAVLLKIVHMLKKDPNPCCCNSPEQNFKVIANFVERDCRFRSSQGVSVSWVNIRDGINLTVEIGKVLLLLVYHDMMNDRITLNNLECDMEWQIANLTGSFVMESEGSVYLGHGLDAHLARRHLSVCREMFERSATTSTSNSSSISSLSDDESPLFTRTKKVTFVGMQTVASSSGSMSPLQEIMNTPKFQMRKMQRQMIKEREYRDGLESELASKTTLIAQRESQINQLQYHLDKLKEEQDDREQVTRKQINEFETKNNSLHMRLDEMLTQNKDYKSNFSLTERKVDELTDENGVLSSQLRAAYSQLTIFEAEVGRLTESQTSTQEEWRTKTKHLQEELYQTTAQKEILTEQVQILQGKISCLEDQISRATKEDVGENMGPVMEREILDGLKNDLETTMGFLNKAEVEIQAKTQQLTEMTQQKELLQKDIAEQRAVLQQEIQDLKLQLEQVEVQKAEQAVRLQQHVAACEKEIEKLKEIKKVKEDLLNQTEEQVKNLETNLSAVRSLLADKDQAIDSFRQDVDILTEQNKKNECEIQAKEEMLAQLLQEKSNLEGRLQSEIQTLTVQVEQLGLSLKQAEEEIQFKHDLLAKTQQENIQQKEVLQQQIITCEEEAQKLNVEVQAKTQQLTEITQQKELLQKDITEQRAFLQQEIQDLKIQLEQVEEQKTEQTDRLQQHVAACEEEIEKLTELKKMKENILTKTEEQVKDLETNLSALNSVLTDKDQQLDCLRKDIDVLAEEKKRNKDEIQAKEEMHTQLLLENSNQKGIFQNEIQTLTVQLEELGSSLKQAEQELKIKQDLLAQTQQENIQQKEVLQQQIITCEEESQRLNVEVQAKTQQLTEITQQKELLQKDITEQTAVLQQEIQDLKIQLEQVEVQKTEQTVRLQQHVAHCEEEIEKLKEIKKGKEDLLNQTEEQVKDLETNLSAVHSLLTEKDQQLDSLRQDIDVLTEENKKIKNEIQLKHDLLAQTQQENIQQREVLQQQIITCEEESQRLNVEVQAKTQQLTEITQQRELLQKDITEQTAVLQQEIQDLKIQLEQVEVQKTEQTDRLQQHFAACEEEIEKLKETKKGKEDLLNQTEEQVKDLETKLSAVHSLLTDKDQQLGCLRKEFDVLVDKNTDEIQAKEEMHAQLLLEHSNQKGILQEKIQTLTVEVVDLGSSLKKAEQELQLKKDLLAQTQQENIQQKAVLQQQIITCEEESQRLNLEVQAKTQQLTEITQQKELLQKDITEQTAVLQQEIQDLKIQLEQVEVQKTEQTDRLQQHVATCEEEIEKLKEIKKGNEDLLNQTEEQVKDLETKLSAVHSLLTDKDQQLDCLRKEFDVFADRNKNEIQAKEEMHAQLLLENSNQKGILQNEIQTLTVQVQDISTSLKQAEQELQLKNDLLAQTQHENNQQREVLQQQIITCEEEAQKLNVEVQAKTQQLTEITQQKELLQKDITEQRAFLQQEIQDLKIQLEQVEVQKTEQTVRLQQQVAVCEEEIQKLTETKKGKEDLLNQTEEQVKDLETKLSAVHSLLTEKDQQLDCLRKEFDVFADRNKNEIQAKEEMHAQLLLEHSNQKGILQNEIQTLTVQVVDLGSSLKQAEQELQLKHDLLGKAQQENIQQREVLQQQIIISEEEAQKLKVEMQAKSEELVNLKNHSNMQSGLLQEEIRGLKGQIEKLNDSLRKAEEQQDMLKKQDQESVLQKDHLQQQLQSIIQDKQVLVNTLKMKEKAEETSELLKKDLQEQLLAKTESAQHYKAQVEKAVNHYNDKKKLLQESQVEVDGLKHSLEERERELKAITMENKCLQLDLQEAQSKEKTLLNTVATLEAQLAYADHNLRTQNKIHGNEASRNFVMPNTHLSVHTRAQVKRSLSSDSLSQSSLDDSLNSTRKLSAPDESSTPLVRSSERLAAKRRGQHAESLETLYFTPISTRQVNRTSTEHKLDSAHRNQSSSVKRRRTTQVINITLTKKTPGGRDDDETFYSLASARSHPNLATSQSVATELFNTPARNTDAASDQLNRLPGYRRSTIHSQPASTFCVGAENEPDGAPDDWMRIAELQARNKICLPHLKSSYPVESEYGFTSAFAFTDEELRTGDPSETIRRASVMPGQLEASLGSRRHSVMVGQTGASVTTRSHRLSLMPGQLPSKTVSSSQLRSTNGTKRSASTLSVHQTSPEKKVKASCFPRPLTPKNKNISSGSQIRPALSPADRRQSMAFVIDNTPKNNNYLKKGLNKLRNSTRKSPGKISKKSPAQTARKHQENVPPGNSHSAAGRTSRVGSKVMGRMKF